MRHPFLFLAAVAVAVSGCGAPFPNELNQSQQGLGHYRYVLVHGAWQGGYVWDDVVQKLKAEDESVTVITLPAHDTDPLATADATMDGYVQRVYDAVHDGGSLPVHLVGHSLGGMIISQYAERDPSSIRDLIYVAGGLPRDGQTVLDILGSDPNSILGNHMVVDPAAMTATLPPSAIGPVMCGDCSAGDVRLLQSRDRVEPLGPGVTPIHLTATNFGSVTKKYLFTTQDVAISYAKQQQMAATVTLAGSASINTAHQPMLSAPGQFTDILRDLAR